MPSEDPSLRASRKDEHVRLAAAQERPAHNDFDDIEFLHHALVGGDAATVDLGVTIAGRRWDLPLYVNGMTGGTERTTRINREIAIAARETGLAMGCGSVSVALDDPAAAEGFRIIRAENPDGVVLANIGVGRSGADAVRAVELVEADALQLHLNAVQETVMREGATDFSGWLRSVEDVVRHSPVPVIAKEVGFGLSRRTLRTLADLGVGIADVAGVGGTDFVRIENDRRDDADYSWLVGFGQSAAASLLDAPEDGPELLASGGVRNPFDVVKSLALGASAVGVAGLFLRAALDDGAEGLVTLVEQWRGQLREVFALLGAANPAQLLGTDVLVRGRLAEFARLRDIDLAAWTRRSDSR